MHTDKINLYVVKDKIYSGSETFTAKGNRATHGPHTSEQWESAATKFEFQRVNISDLNLSLVLTENKSKRLEKY